MSVLLENINSLFIGKNPYNRLVNPTSLRSAAYRQRSTASKHLNRLRRSFARGVGSPFVVLCVIRQVAPLAHRFEVVRLAVFRRVV
jgi:hypothetical protein